MSVLFRRVAVAAFLVVALLRATPSEACGPDCTPPPPTEDPAECLGKMQGDVTTLGPRCRAVAFLVLRGLSAADRKAIQEALGASSDDGGRPEAPWRAMRARVPGVQPLPEYVPVDRRFPGTPGVWFTNCLPGAFQMAAKTLEARLERFGVDSPEAAAWVAAQDRVFANCGSAEQVLPEPAPADAPELLRADRAYQTAAALFYAGAFDEAVKQLDAIAQDSASPWRLWARLVAVRALIRKALLQDQGFTKEMVPLLEQARTRCEAIVKDRSARDIHLEIRKLTWLIDYRLRPDKQLSLLGRVLLEKPDVLFRHAWTDYFRLRKGRSPDGWYDWDDERARRLQEVKPQDELSVFIDTFDSADTYPQALEWWRKQRSVPWLVAALSRARHDAPELPELLAAASALPESSPATVSLRVARARLAVDAGRWEEARELLLPLLEKDPKRLDPRTADSLATHFLGAARSFEEWARFAHLSFRAPAFFNERVPLARLAEAPMLAALEPKLRKEVVLAGWVRAVLLERWEVAQALEPQVEALAPELKADLSRVRERTEPKARKLAAVLLLLKSPGLSPFVRVHWIDDERSYRSEHLRSYDICRMNGWCPEGTEDLARACAPEQGRCVPHFFSDAEHQAVKQEREALAKAGKAPELLIRHVLEYAQAHPDDALVPEALAKSVTQTHYAHNVCIDYGQEGKERSALSKQAFRLLHRKYPKSQWARETPYHY
jgi:hypothetical protein